MSKIGTGVLNWWRDERIGDRYGAVGLWVNPMTGSLTPTARAVLPLDRSCEGQPGRLIAHIKEVRRSPHVGDFFRGLTPQTPSVGEVIVLGEGLLFFDEETSEDDGVTQTLVGLKPYDGRATDWLNPQALYRCHNQTVELRFEATPPATQEEAEGACT